jgi:hypothetical protein
MKKRATGKFTKACSVYDDMPYARFADLEILVVEKALRTVWSEAPKRFHCHRINFNTAEEEEISSALVLVFDNLWASDRHLLSDLERYFNPMPVYDNPHGAVDYLGRALKFRPDLTFRRAHTDVGVSPINSSLFIEAKLIEQGKSMGNYCGDGLIRFVNGTYAWAMPQAMMLGYVRNTGQTLPDSLAKHFERRGKRALYQLTNGPAAFSLSRFSSRSHITVHDRAWKYPETDSSPGPISVLHIWLPV